MHQMTYFDWERIMIKVGLLAARKNLVHDDRVAKCNVTVRQMRHIFSDSLGILLQNLIANKNRDRIEYTELKSNKKQWK